MRLIHIAFIPSILSVLLLGACVAKDPDSLGDLEAGNDEDASESGGSTHGSTDDGATTAPPATGGSDGSEGGTETGEPDDPCPAPELVYNEPPCNASGMLPLLPGAGCYAPCDGPDAACDAGTCVQVQVDPCACGEGGDCCEACGSVEAWLCLEEPAVDGVCEAIVGTSFSSIEELECGLGPMGVELCHWQIDFEDDGDYLWMYSDVGEGGTYTCEGGVITTSLAHEIAYDQATGILTWDGVEYVAAPA